MVPQITSPQSFAAAAASTVAQQLLQQEEAVAAAAVSAADAAAKQQPQITSPQVSGPAAAAASSKPGASTQSLVHVQWQELCYNGSSQHGNLEDDGRETRACRQLQRTKRAKPKNP